MKINITLLFRRTIDNWQFQERNQRKYMGYVILKESQEKGRRGRMKLVSGQLSLHLCSGKMKLKVDTLPSKRYIKCLVIIDKWTTIPGFSQISFLLSLGWIIISGNQTNRVKPRQKGSIGESYSIVFFFRFLFFFWTMSPKNFIFTDLYTKACFTYICKDYIWLYNLVDIASWYLKRYMGTKRVITVSKLGSHIMVSEFNTHCIHVTC